MIEGINTVIVGTKYSSKQSFPRRIFSFLSFVLLSTYTGLRTRGIDIVYATSTPLTVGIPAITLKYLKRVPYIFEVRDQWPEIPIEMGIIRSKILTNLLRLLEKIIYKQSVAIVALSPGMANGIRAKLKQQKKISVIPNSSDTNIFRPDIDGSEVGRERGWTGKLVLMYFGAMGKANGLRFLVDAANRLKEYEDIHFVLIGDGNEKASLINKVKRYGLKNIEILDVFPKTELPRIVAACDISTVIFANYPILQHNCANKFFDSLSAGKPVLLNYSGWQARIIEEHNAGFGCELCNLEQFIERVLFLNSHRDQLVEMGQNARRIAQDRFARDKLAQQALETILQTKR
jgi:glycosyltransferase involved in cell wall biosynthesis